MCWKSKSTLHVVSRLAFLILLILWKGWLPRIMEFIWIPKYSSTFTHLVPKIITFEALNITHPRREGISICRSFLRSKIQILTVYEIFISFNFNSYTINICMSKHMKFTIMTIKQIRVPEVGKFMKVPLLSLVDSSSFGMTPLRSWNCYSSDGFLSCLLPFYLHWYFLEIFLHKYEIPHILQTDNSFFS